MYVIATAGHVDHGKSTLVKALTGMEPDRWEEERCRGLTIDLGFVWTTLDSGANVAFVDVPGHERFIGNMLAGVGPAPAVMFVVAADEGWQAQSSDHRDALAALGIERGLVVLTRTDRTDDAGIAATADRVRAELAGTSLAQFPVVSVSAHTGAGLEELKHRLDGLLAGMEKPRHSGPVRLWIDRAFTVTGSGTVVTGTLNAGTLTVGDRLELHTAAGVQTVDVRGLQSENRPHTAVGPVSRVAVNLRGIPAEAISRGDSLLSPGHLTPVAEVDVRLTTGRSSTTVDATRLPQELTLHVGTSTIQARLRALDSTFARIRLAHPAPLELGDRIVARAPGSRHVAAGLHVVDIAPPALTRRGDAARRAHDLLKRRHDADPLDVVKRQGAVKVTSLSAQGLDTSSLPKGIIAFRDWWIYAPEVTAWKKALINAVQEHAKAQPLSPGLSRRAAVNAVGLASDELLGIAVAAARYESRDGLIVDPARKLDLGPAEPAVAELERRLNEDPFAAPEAKELAALGLGPKELAAAERAGRVLRVSDAIVLPPAAPAHAIRLLGSIEQPFTTSQARQVLGTTRRVAIPLLEYLDRKGLTRRLDGQRREVC